MSYKSQLSTKNKILTMCNFEVVPKHLTQKLYKDSKPRFLIFNHSDTLVTKPYRMTLVYHSLKKKSAD